MPGVTVYVERLPLPGGSRFETHVHRELRLGVGISRTAAAVVAVLGRVLLLGGCGAGGVTPSTGAQWSGTASTFPVTVTVTKKLGGSRSR